MKLRQEIGSMPQSTWRKIILCLGATVSDINSWDTSCQHLLFPPRAFPAPLNVVYRSSVTKSFTPTLRGKEEAEVSQQLCLGLCKREILGM